jgi:hypothetical protein
MGCVGLKKRKKKEKCIHCFIGNLDGNSPFRRRKSRWVYNVKIDLKRVWDGMDCSYLIQCKDRMNTILKRRVPGSETGNFLNS